MGVPNCTVIQISVYDLRHMCMYIDVIYVHVPVYLCVCVSVSVCVCMWWTVPQKFVLARL